MSALAQRATRKPDSLDHPSCLFHCPKYQAGARTGRDIRLRHRKHRLRRVIYGGAAQFASFAEVEATSAMDRGTIVPHNKISDLPLVRVYALTLRGVLEQVGQQQPRLSGAHVDDLARMYADKQDLAT